MGTVTTLTEKMDALADALRAAGVEQERIAKILGSAAEATMHALMLDAVLDEQAAAAKSSDTPVRADESEPERGHDFDVPLAA